MQDRKPETTLPPRRIKIVFLVTSLEVGGSERQLVALCHGLPTDRYEKHLVCLSGLGPLEEDARASGAVMHDLEYPRLKSAGTIQWKNLPSVATTVARFVRLLRSLRPDILHTFIPVCNVLGALAGKIAGVPCIVCTKLALGVYRDTSHVLPILENWTDRWFDLVHCKSRGIMEDIARREPIPSERMRIIYNGLRTEKYERQIDVAGIRRQLGIPPDNFVVGMVANLIPYKGHADMIAAARTVLDEFPGTRFLFVGRDDGIGPALLDRARQLGILEALTFTGVRSDIPDLMGTMDALVSASHQEGFSNVLLEGMASGLPIVATRVGGNPEAVADGDTGLLVDAHAPEQLAEAVLKLVRNPAAAREMGLRGRERVKALFSYDAMIKGMRAFYDEALSATR